MEELINAFGNVGFPIALVIYLLARFEKKLIELDDEIAELSHLIRSKSMQKRNDQYVD